MADERVDPLREALERIASALEAEQDDRVVVRRANARAAEWIRAALSSVSAPPPEPQGWEEIEGLVKRLEGAVDARVQAWLHNPESFPAACEKNDRARDALLRALRASVSAAPVGCDPIFHCRDGWHEIGCPRRVPGPACTCKMPIGFGRSFKGFMAPDPKCPVHAPPPTASPSGPGGAAGGEGEIREALEQGRRDAAEAGPAVRRREGDAMSETICAADCKGILLSGDPYIGDWSGCSCASGLLANGQPQPPDFQCDCPQHPTPERPGRCRQPMWWGYGAPAGLCGKPAFGPGRTRPLVMACEHHGGPRAPRSGDGKEGGTR